MIIGEIIQMMEEGTQRPVSPLIMVARCVMVNMDLAFLNRYLKGIKQKQETYIIPLDPFYIYKNKI